MPLTPIAELRVINAQPLGPRVGLCIANSRISAFKGVVVILDP